MSKVTDFHKKIMKERLLTHKEDTPQMVALHNQTFNLESVLLAETETSIFNLLEKLKIKSVLLSDEVTNLKDVYCRNIDEFVFDFVHFLSMKKLEQVKAFANILMECDAMKELGTELNDMLDYCKNLKGNKFLHILIII